MSKLKTAFDEYCKELCEAYPDDSEFADAFVSKKTEKRIFRAFDLHDNIFSCSVGRRVASAAVILLLFSACALSVRAVREPVFNFVAKTFENITSVTFFGTGSEQKVDLVAVTPSYIPENFSLVHSKIDDDSFDCVYQSGNAENYIVYFQNVITPKLRMEFDTQYTNAEKIYVGDYDGYLVQQKGNVTIVFFTDKYSFHVSTDLSWYEAMDIAFSITLSESFKEQKLSVSSSADVVEKTEDEQSLQKHTSSYFDGVLQQSDITADLREKFFDIAREYHMYRLPYFDQGETPAFYDFKWYAYLIAGDNTLRGSLAEEIAQKYFGVSYGLADDDIVSFEIGTLPDACFAELVGYLCEPQSDGLYKVTAIFVDRNAFHIYYSTPKEQQEYEFDYDSYCDYSAETFYAYNVMKQTGLTPFETVKYIITRGDGEKIAYMSDDPDYEQQYYQVTYTSKDGITPERFLSSTRFYL